MKHISTSSGRRPLFKLWHVAGNRRGLSMLWTIAVILLVLWLLGLVTSYTLGGFIHVLLVVAVVLFLVRVIQGRRMT